MISREIGLLRQAQVLPSTCPSLSFIHGVDSASRHLRDLAGLFCDHELPKTAMVRLPQLNETLTYDGKAWRVHGLTVAVAEGLLTLAVLLEDSLLEGHLIQVPYWQEAVERYQLFSDFHCFAQHPAGPTKAVLSILDAARQLYTLDAPAKAMAAAKVARAVCLHYSAFALHFTYNGIYALSEGAYLGAVPRLDQQPAAVLSAPPVRYG